MKTRTETELIADCLAGNEVNLLTAENKAIDNIDEIYFIKEMDPLLEAS